MPPESATKAEEAAREQARLANVEKTKADEQRKIALESQRIAEEREKQVQIASYFDKIHLADKEFAARNYYRTNQLLESCPNELCGFEWYYLWQKQNSVKRSVDLDDISRSTFNQEGNKIICTTKTSMANGFSITRFCTEKLKLSKRI